MQVSIGAVLLLLTQTTFSVPSLMGAIMTVGVATANSILVVSFAKTALHQGQTAIEAALSAGHARLRPVIMTVIAMVFGMIPMSLGLSEGGDQNAPLGRAVIVGLSQAPLEVNPYQTLIGYEAEIIGSNDHLLQELPLLIDMARRKILDTSHVVSQRIPLNAEKVNQRLDDLEHYTNDVRAVIVQRD